jgi:hypothetical protein
MTAKTFDVAMVRPIIDNSNQEEEHGRDRAVIEHLQDGTVDPLSGKTRHAEHYISHMADAGISDQFLKISLRHRAQRAVNDIPGAERA